MKKDDYCNNCPEIETCTIPCEDWMSWNETRARMREEGWDE